MFHTVDIVFCPPLIYVSGSEKSKNIIVGGKNLSNQLQNATSKFSGKFQINVIKLIKLDDDMCHTNWHHIGISKFATCHLAHKIKINSLFKIYG